MKQVFLSFLLMLLPVVVNAQEPVLEYDGDLYFIPAPLTKEGITGDGSADHNDCQNRRLLKTSGPRSPRCLTETLLQHSQTFSKNLGDSSDISKNLSNFVGVS